MLTCGVAEICDRERRRARLVGQELRRLGQDLHQALRARRRGPRVELGLGVDHARDQRGIEVLLGRLLANDVRVGERQVELGDRLAKQRRREDHHERGRGERDHRDHPAAPARDRATPGGRSGAASTGGSARGDRRHYSSLLTAAPPHGHGLRGPACQEPPTTSTPRSSIVIVIGDHICRSLRFFLLGQLPGEPLGERLVTPGSGALRPRTSSSAIDRDRRVEHALHAGLEQQRHLDDGGSRRR